MKIFINQDSKKFVTSEKFNATIQRFDFKRGDTTRVQIGYVQDNKLVELDGGYTIVFGIKEEGKYDGDYVVYESASFLYNPATGFYEGEPNFNTTELNLLLGADDGDDTNDIPFVDCLFEIAWNDDYGISSSSTSTARIAHDVNKGNEGIPTGANPSYSVIGHTHPEYQTGIDNNALAITAIEARDWVALPNGSLNEAALPSSYPTLQLSVMNTAGITPGGWPDSDSGRIFTDRRLGNDEQISQHYFDVNGSVYYRSGIIGFPTEWASWGKTIQSEGGTIIDNLELSGTNYTAPNLVSTDPDSLVKRSDLNALYTHGIEDHNSTDVSFSPAAGVKTKVLNNGLGSFTNTAYKIPGRGDIWDASTSEFDFLNAGLELGDTVTIRMDFELTTTSANDGFKVELDLGTGGNLYTLTLADQYYRFTGTNNFTVISEIYMGDANTLDNPGTIYITPDAAGSTIKYNGHYVKYSLRTPSID